MALISKKKIPYKINSSLRSYLKRYGREQKLPLKYKDLLRFDNRIPLLDKNNNDTLWETVFYSQSDLREIYENLKVIYADLKTDGDESVIQHLVVDRVDTCTYANTSPFRIRIINKVNDNYDYFYIKNADSSRVYGLELEHLLSPNVLSYITHEDTLVEEHIAGIPGDIFMEFHLNDLNLNPIRLAKEFIKFNERCFARLLGDMHSANFVVIITPDFEDFHYRIRAIDFDQQSYEGSKSVYMPQYFRENNAIIELGIKYMTPESVKQYQKEERTLIGNRIKSEKERLNNLMAVMRKDDNYLPENLVRIKRELNEHHKTDVFTKCKSMAEVLETNLTLLST
ncbi:hypothetical protein [Arcticibacterium luteifluviistationis]|uniref:Uncharacterized protein n=1 Tax=Arcticibacterium luteifluviistationis TaxID=1784714 RepID=A0A2Z4G9B4_9BACT|nr:hypothetical protein [Arcticibacterium luteifluviistationis]AWV97744.1 hypothetical protein DJ013_06015 [Arcticibacterium luteifluviistationis]